MNERMKQLKEQAIMYAFDQRFKEIPDGPRDLQEVWVEKFAELLIQECCDIFVELRTRPADLAVRDVKKHFGVEL